MTARIIVQQFAANSVGVLIEGNSDRKHPNFVLMTTSLNAAAESYAHSVKVATGFPVIGVSSGASIPAQPANC